MFQIAMTPQEKKQIDMYWEEQRQKAYRIRDEYDRIQEEKYHFKLYNKCDKSKNNKSNRRPEFFSPLPKHRKITK